jgi:hypothetical protein
VTQIVDARLIVALSAGSFHLEREMLSTWFALTVDATRLGIELQGVIGQRLIKIAAGGTAAQTEATRMITEKATAFAEAAAIVATGGSARRVVRRYRTRVKANARRLSRLKSD